MTRRQHHTKVHHDYFDAQQMMEDADGYNQIWTAMMLAWPDITHTQHDLESEGVARTLGNFRDYIDPSGRIFQFASGLSAHYTGPDWIAIFERAATLTGDGTFRFAAKQMYDSAVRQGGGTHAVYTTGTGDGAFWASMFVLLCGNRDPVRGSAGSGSTWPGWSVRADGAGKTRRRICGPGGYNYSIPLVTPASYDHPSSVVHFRNEPTRRTHASVHAGTGSDATGGGMVVPDKIVMAHTKALNSTRAYVTIAAHTGRSLFHSHSVDTGAITSFWYGGARMLGPAGKHDGSANHANHIVLQRASIPTAAAGWSPSNGTFPQRNASDMYTPGDAATPWSYLMMPTATRLPMVDMAGAGFLERNLSALGFTCDNWMNESVVMTVMPIALHGPVGLKL